MWKKFMTLFLAVVIVMAVTACAGPKPSGSEKIMPTIEDIKVNEQGTKSIDEHEDAFIYSFDGNNISIKDGVVFGIVAGTTTVVTAKSEYGETTFRVTVNAALVGKIGTDSAFVLNDSDYVKTDNSYGESLCMLEGQPFNRDGLIATGTFVFDTTEENAEIRIFMRDGSGKDVYLAATPYNNGYYARGVAGIKIKNIGAYSQSRINFLVYVSDGTAYYYLNDLLVWNAPVQGDAQLGFGSQNATVTLSRLSLAYNAELVGQLKTKANELFGANIYGNRASDAFAFENIGDDKYRKSTDAYQQLWLYYGANPVSGRDYTVTGTVEMLDSVEAAEVVWQACNNEGELMRVLLRYNHVNKSYFIFTDYEYTNGFEGSRLCKDGVPNKFDFTFRYLGGVTTFSIGNEVIVESDSSTINNIGYMGDTHFGFAGQRCRIILSNISADMA